VTDFPVRLKPKIFNQDEKKKLEIIINLNEPLKTETDRLKTETEQLKTETENYGIDDEILLVE